MIYVVLRNGKVLEYNDADACTVEDGTLTLRTGKAAYLVARLPLDVVERAEWNRPCKVMREARLDSAPTVTRTKSV